MYYASRNQTHYACNAHKVCRMGNCKAMSPNIHSAIQFTMHAEHPYSEGYTYSEGYFEANLHSEIKPAMYAQRGSAEHIATQQAARCNTVV